MPARSPSPRSTGRVAPFVSCCHASTRRRTMGERRYATQPSDLAARLEDLQQLVNHPLALSHISAADRGRHTAVEVPLHHDAVELVERSLDRFGLLENLDTIGIVLDHPLDAANMPLDRLQPVEQLLFIRHSRLLRSPPQGVGSLYPARGSPSSPVNGRSGSGSTVLSIRSPIVHTYARRKM